MVNQRVYDVAPVLLKRLIAERMSNEEEVKRSGALKLIAGRGVEEGIKTGIFISISSPETFFILWWTRQVAF